MKVKIQSISIARNILSLIIYLHYTLSKSASPISDVFREFNFVILHILDYHFKQLRLNGDIQYLQFVN